MYLYSAFTARTIGAYVMHVLVFLLKNKYVYLDHPRSTSGQNILVQIGRRAVLDFSAGKMVVRQNEHFWAKPLRSSASLGLN